MLIGDQSEIALFSGNTASLLDYRLALLARPGDIAVVRRLAPAFEAYLVAFLGMDGVRFLEGRQGDPAPIAKQCRKVDTLRRPLEERLRDAGDLTIRSYLTTGHDWRLAESFGAAADCPVYVHGPTPRIARRANDKLWFWRLTRRLLGTPSVPPTFHAFGPAAASAHVARIAASGRDAIVKIPDSAGGSGNLRLPATLTATLDLAAIRDLILGRLTASGWAGRYPILVGVWESGVLQSPSVQVFIPLPDEGVPDLHGLFEQRVTGAGGEFVGAVPARLSPNTRRRMRKGALALASVFQSLGYFGWCSFDAILTETGELHWIECNARWGGVSIPLDAATRILGNPPQGFAIAQEQIDRYGIDVDELVEILEDILLQDGKREGLILMSPPDPQMRLSFNVAAVAASQPAAEALIETAKSRLI